MAIVCSRRKKTKFFTSWTVGDAGPYTDKLDFSVCRFIL